MPPPSSLTEIPEAEEEGAEGGEESDSDSGLEMEEGGGAAEGAGAGAAAGAGVAAEGAGATAKTQVRWEINFTYLLFYTCMDCSLRSEEAGAQCIYFKFPCVQI